eukprot:TRINITY_DN58_c1_g1_i1.p1 TRINITY_DN58_c1_g1~~TRINITY_DN58_c1_g1_i1.p1  ORF type:complete len:222 (+),score=135.45 TRINITY_DN58_c1_g1_i1:46-711(+)
MSRNNPFYTSNLDEAERCVACNQEVYPNDKVLALKGCWHKACLKCTSCGAVLTVRMLESFQNQPYCKAHKPTHQAKQVTDSVAIKQAVGAPKAARRAQGVKRDERMSFMPGTNNPLEQQLGQAPHAYVPNAGPKTAARRVQGVNKSERMTFFAPNTSGNANVSSGNAAPVYDPNEFSTLSAAEQEAYNQYDEQYDPNQGYDEQNYQEGEYTENAGGGDEDW